MSAALNLPLAGSALCLLLALSPAYALAFDANGVALGGREADITKAFPSAHCKALEWKSDAADRRCDDSRVALAGINAKATFYLKAGTIQAFDLRFDAREREKVAAHLKSRWGVPQSEATETVKRREAEERRTYKARWQKGKDHALLSAAEGGKRASLSASRGNFDDEIYRVR